MFQTVICGTKLISQNMVPFSFNHITAMLGVLYVTVLFYYYRRLKEVWRRRAERARYGMILFVVLFLLSIGSFTYVYYVMKSKHALEREAAGVINQAKYQEKQKPVEDLKKDYALSKSSKIAATLILSYLAFRRIMFKS